MKSPYSLEHLKNLSAPEWSNIKGKELRQTYQQVKEIYYKRSKSFAKHGEGQHAYVLPSSKGLKEYEMRNILKEALQGVDYKRRTYKGWSSAEKIRKAKIEDTLYKRYQIKFTSRAQWDAFDKFMDDMEKRYGEFNNYMSGTAAKIYAQAFRIGGDPRQFMDNYDYWEAHLKDLYKMPPVKRRSDTPPKPSYFARKAGLEKINSWNKSHRDELIWNQDDEE